MNKFKPVIFAAVLTFAGFIAGYGVGYDAKDGKNYEVACHMSDLIRCYEDHLRSDSLMDDHGCFEELERIFLWDSCVVENPVRLRDYSWCY